MPSDRHPSIPDAFPVLRVAMPAGELLLREVQPSDATAWFRRLSDPEVAFPQGAELMTSIDEAHDAIRSVREGFRDKRMRRWGIVPPGETETVGTTGFNTFLLQAAHPGSGEGRAELGYGLARGFWGRGLMSAATAAAVDYAFAALGLHRIEAYGRTDNPRSASALERCGFEREGTLRERHFEQGAWRDYWLYGRVRG